MRFPLRSRTASACALATLVFSLGFSPSFARMGGAAGGSFVHPSFGMGHGSHFAPRGFNPRSETGRFGFNRFGPNRFDRFAFHRFNRFGGNQLLVGGWGDWGWDGWGGVRASAGASGPVVVEEGGPVIINIGVDPGQSDPGGALDGSCVIHKLTYDNAGKYVGERQIPHC